MCMKNYIKDIQPYEFKSTSHANGHVPADMLASSCLKSFQYKSPTNINSKKITKKIEIETLFRTQMEFRSEWFIFAFIRLNIT